MRPSKAGQPLRATPQLGTMAPSQSDLVLVAYNAPQGSSVAAGSGYTLGISPSLNVGGFQYGFNKGPGAVSTAFGAGVSGVWGASGLAFKPLASSLSVSPTSITAIKQTVGVLSELQCSVPNSPNLYCHDYRLMDSRK